MGIIKDIIKLIVNIIKSGFKIIKWLLKKLIIGLIFSKKVLTESNDQKKYFQGLEKRSKERHNQFNEEIL